MIKLTDKKSLEDFSDREMLEFILCNQVYLERRLDRIEERLSIIEKESIPFERKQGFQEDFQELAKKYRSIHKAANEWLGGDVEEKGFEL